AFSSIKGSSQPPQPATGYTLTIIGSQARWRVSATQPWVHFSQTSGTGAGNVAVTADASGLGLGPFGATITVTHDDSGATRSFVASLVNRAARLTLSPTNLNLTIDTFTPASALTQQIVVSDELNGTLASEAVTWSLQSVSAPWVQW